MLRFAILPETWSDYIRKGKTS